MRECFIKAAKKFRTRRFRILGFRKCRFSIRFGLLCLFNSVRIRFRVFLQCQQIIGSNGNRVLQFGNPGVFYPRGMRQRRVNR